MLNIIRMLILACIIYLPICPEQKNVTIWIHGTMTLMPKFIQRSYFHLQLGLTHIHEYPEKAHLFIIAKTLHKADAEKFNLEDYYTFGWSGALNFTARKQAAEQLYQEIQQLITKYVSIYGEKPYIRIIGHSHGGNVILNLAQIKEESNSLLINEIILLATPVQEKTKQYIQADCFKKVYSFYSGSDLLQIIDLQGLYKNSPTKKIFSERRFDDCDKLQQAHIKFNGRSAMHIEFIFRPFLKHLPALCHEVDKFHHILTPNQKTYEKIINIHTKKGTTQLIKTIKENKSKKYA